MQENAVRDDKEESKLYNDRQLSSSMAVVILFFLCMLRVNLVLSLIVDIITHKYHTNIERQMKTENLS